MPTNTSSNLAAVQAAPTLANRNAPGKAIGELRYVHAAYTILGTEAQSDTFNIIKLPAGAEIIPHLCRASHISTLATTATLDVGDDDVLGVGAAADPDRYCDGIDIAAAGVDAFATGVADSTPYVLGSDAWIIGTFATLVTPVAGVVLNIRLACVLPN
jgi:hypothetical protein